MGVQDIFIAAGALAGLGAFVALLVPAWKKAYKPASNH